MNLFVHSVRLAYHYGKVSFDSPPPILLFSNPQKAHAVLVANFDRNNSPRKISKISWYQIPKYEPQIVVVPDS